MITTRTLLFKFIGSHKWWATFVIIAVLINNLVRVLIPLSIGYFYKINFHSSGGKLELLQAMGIDINTNVQYLQFVVLLMGLFSLFYFIQLYAGGKLSEVFAMSLREQLFKQQMLCDLDIFQKEKIEKSILRYGSDMRSIHHFISKGIVVFIGDCIYALFMLIIFYFISPIVALAILLFYVVIWIAIQALTTNSYKYISYYYDKRAILLQFVHEQFQRLYSIKSFNKETIFIKEFNKKNKKIYASANKKLLHETIQNVLIRISVFGSIFLVLCIIAVFKKEVISKDAVLVFILLLLYFQSTVKRILQVPAVWRKGNEAFKKITNILNQPFDKRIEQMEQLDIVGHIKFDQVSYFMQDKDLPIVNLTFEIQANAISQIKTSATFVKTTVLRLIQKMYSHHDGTILLDHISYHNFSPFELRKHITFVGPEAELIGDNLFDTVTYNSNENKKEKVIQWLKKIQFQTGEIDEAILHLPIHDNIEHFSKQDKKLLQYVRAFISTKKIILIDEPFEFLSDKYCDIISNILNDLAKKRTIIIASNQQFQTLTINKIIQL